MYTDLIVFNNENSDINFCKCIKVNVIKAFSKQELEKKINSIKTGLVMAEAGDFARSIVENKKVDIIVGCEKDRKDSLHFRGSGLNQVLCKLAYKNNIAVAFNFNEILRSKSFERAELLGRMKQNVSLCRKYKVKMIMASFARNKFELKKPQDLISFGIVIGMTPKEAKESLMNASKILEEKPKRIAEGVRLSK